MEANCQSTKIPENEVYGELLKVHVESSYRRPVKIEICQSLRSKIKREDLEEAVKKYLVGQPMSPLAETVHSTFADAYLAQNVEHITVSPVNSTSGIFEESLLDESEMCTYQMQNEMPFNEELEEEVTAARTWMLPCRELDGLWGSLYYEEDLKENLLEYMRTTLLFSDNKVDPNVVTWNRLILLHGPPGTGKTSLCRALAHKLAISLSRRYAFSQLLEINSHSLFSKWFSESGKLVLKMFQKIEEIASNPRVLVFVLIDEVESLTSSRHLMSSNEPTESIRVVNALLTQLDLVKRHPNVLVLATSNMTSVVDSAFLDRADVKQYVGLPGRLGVYEIFRTCVEELHRVGIVSCFNEVLLERHLLRMLLGTEDFGLGRHPHTIALLRVAELCEGLSGRTLRKLPFLAHALYLQKPNVTLTEFLTALSKAAKKHLEDEKKKDDVSK